MTSCQVCGGTGIVRVRYHDGAPDAFGVCLCPAGRTMRNSKNAGKQTGVPLWLVWAAREQVDPAQIVMVEELLDDDELARIPRTGTRPAATIAAAMQTRKPRL